MRRRSTRIGTALLSIAALSASCGEPFAPGSNTSAPSTTTATGGTGGTGPEGGTGAATVSTTSSESSGGASAPAECTPGAIGACGDGRYCAKSTDACTPCNDLSRLHFAAPHPIPLSPSTSGTTAFYPRVGPDDGALYFVYVDESGALPRSRIASAPFKKSTGAWGGWSLMIPPVGSPAEESAPLQLPDGAILDGLVDTTVIDVTMPVLLFDSTRNGASTRKLFAANVDGSAASVVSLPSGKRDTDVAAAPLASPPRFYWISDGAVAMAPRLVTAVASASQMTPVNLSLDNGCVVDAVEGPWTTPDGKMLLFGAHPPVGATCMPVPTSNDRLFAARMTDQGQQVQGELAAPLFPDDELSFDGTPSLSPDGCFLLFSRFDPLKNEGRPMIAVRD